MLNHHFKARLFSSGLMTVIVVASSLSLAANLPSTPTELSTLHQGKVLVREIPPRSTAKDALPSVSAQILISKPPSEVWKKILQPEQLMQREKKVKSIRVVSQTGTSKDLSYTVVFSHLLPTFQYTLRHQTTTPMTLAFWRLNGSFKDVKGSWNVSPADGGKNSVLTYNLSIDPGPLVPRMLLQSVIKADLPNMMNNVKSVVASP